VRARWYLGACRLGCPPGRAQVLPPRRLPRGQRGCQVPALQCPRGPSGRPSVPYSRGRPARAPRGDPAWVHGGCARVSAMSRWEVLQGPRRLHPCSPVARGSRRGGEGGRSRCRRRHRREWGQIGMRWLRGCCGECRQCQPLSGAPPPGPHFSARGREALC